MIKSIKNKMAIIGLAVSVLGFCEVAHAADHLCNDGGIVVELTTLVDGDYSRIGMVVLAPNGEKYGYALHPDAVKPENRHIRQTIWQSVMLAYATGKKVRVVTQNPCKTPQQGYGQNWNGSFRAIHLID